MLSLTPAYDICPQLRTGGEAFQAMAYGPGGERISQVGGCVEHHIDTIRSEWSEVCDLAQLASAERERLWRRQFLNPFSLGT